jgi:hypothetical protein
MPKECNKTSNESEGEDGSDCPGCQDRGDGDEGTQGRHDRHEDVVVSDGQEAEYRGDETYKTDQQTTRDE